MSWAIIRIEGGERFLCQAEEDEFRAAMEMHTPLEVENVYSITTLTIMQQHGPSRMTMLEYPDLQDGEKLPSMTVNLSALYIISDERAEKEISSLEAAMEQSKKAQEEMKRHMESEILQARLTPMGPGGPHLGSLIKPPGMR